MPDLFRQHAGDRRAPDAECLRDCRHASAFGTKLTDSIFDFRRYTRPAQRLAAAMISYCRHTRIPLPRKAKKQIDVVNNQLVVKLTLGRPDEGVLKVLAATN